MDLGDMVNTNDVLREVAYQNEEFDLFEFLIGNKKYSDLTGACGFITRKQSFYCESSSYHGMVFENVCGSVLEGDVAFNGYNTYYDRTHNYYRNESFTEDSWRSANAVMGIVSLQITFKHIIVWVPEAINSFQKEKILDFCSIVKKANKYLTEHNLPEIEVFFNIFKVDRVFEENGKQYKDGRYDNGVYIDDFIKEIDSFVDDNCESFDEYMISDYVFKEQKKR